MVIKYFKGHYKSSTDLIGAFEAFELEQDVALSLDLEKLLQLLFLGQLVGLQTLNSILIKFGISSNYRQIKYRMLCNRLTNSKMRHIFEHEFISVLEDMCKKDSSCWSKQSISAVLDDSIFRQWLAQHTDSYYGCYFSGQYKATVYGYKVVSLGLAIDGVMYPLYFDFVKNDKTQKSIELANKLIRRWRLLVEKLKKQGIDLPKIHLSCDSGYSDKGLCENFQENHLNYISVPKKVILLNFVVKKQNYLLGYQTIFCN